MPRPYSSRRKCGICSFDKKYPVSRRKRKVVRDVIKEG